MEISEKANDRKLEELTTTLTAKMDSNQTSLVANTQSILASIQQLIRRPPLAAPSPEAVAVPVTVPPAETIAIQQSRDPLVLPPHRVYQDDDSPRKRKSDFGDDIVTRERPYNPEDDQQHTQQYQHRLHQQYQITPGNSQVGK